MTRPTFHLIRRSLFRRNIQRNLCNCPPKFEEVNYTSLAAESETSIDSITDLKSLLSSLSVLDRRRMEDCVIDYHLLKNLGWSSMPSRMTVVRWRRLLEIKSKRGRIVYLSALYDCDREKAEQKKKSAEARKLREAAREDAEESSYGSRRGNGIFSFLTNSQLLNQYNSNLSKAMLFGPNLVIDMSRIPILRLDEWNRTGRQLRLAHHFNRMYRSPHHLIFTGCRRDHESWDSIQRYFVNGIDSCLYTVSEDSYVGMFPKDRLIYLSPDAELPLTKYDHEKTYVLGALVNLFPKPGLTKRIASEQGIETRRLPLERIRFAGRVALCLYHVVNIMNELHVHDNIEDAMKKTLACLDPDGELQKQRRHAKEQRRQAYKMLNERITWYHLL